MRRTWVTFAKAERDGGRRGADEGKGVELLTSQLLLLLGLPDSGFNKTDPNFPAMFAVLRWKGAPYKKIENTEHILFYSRHSFYKIKPPKFNFRWGTCDFPVVSVKYKKLALFCGSIPSQRTQITRIKLLILKLAKFVLWKNKSKPFRCVRF